MYFLFSFQGTGNSVLNLFAANNYSCVLVFEFKGIWLQLFNGVRHIEMEPSKKKVLIVCTLLASCFLKLPLHKTVYCPMKLPFPQI